MLNLLLRAQVPRKAGAKLQLFYELSKSFAKFYSKSLIFSSLREHKERELAPNSLFFFLHLVSEIRDSD